MLVIRMAAVQSGRVIISLNKVVELNQIVIKKINLGNQVWDQSLIMITAT